MGGGVCGRPASLAGFTSFFIVLSAALAASTPVTSVASGGYNGLYEQVCPRLSSLRILAAKECSDQRQQNQNSVDACTAADVCHRLQYNNN